MAEDKIKLGISSCLLGNKVRYDGQHQYDSWLVEELGPYVEYVPVCPEVECGLPVPREAMRLVGNPDSPRLVTNKTGIDLTDKMLLFCQRKVEELANHQLCGFVFKSKSPSSGMERVKVYPEGGGTAEKKGRGLFANAFMQAFPLIPVEDEGRLHDPDLRENFIERIFIMQRWYELINNNPTAGDLLNFHTKHKYLLMAHSPVHYRSMGKLVADHKSYKLQDFLPIYFEQLMIATAKPATRAKQQNVLLHIMGYFKANLSAEEKAELLDIINKYKAAHYPLIVPITLLNHYVHKYSEPYLTEQYYLNPSPVELNLRNHV
jgi:uncharacterized protein YbgA (DUF1722 family)/uncharacterized protein YbbK (DUF523 family)